MKKKKKRQADKPMLVKEWSKKIKARKGKRLKESIELPIARINVPQGRGRFVDYKVFQTATTVEIALFTKTIGEHRFPPSMDAVQTDRKKLGSLKMDHVNGFIPKFLSVNSLPKELPKKLRRHKFIDGTRKIGEKQGQTTSVFNPDERYTFSDTSFPWCTCGLVETGAGNGSGVMIGPRHLMTASHVINWGPNNTAGWLKFTPLYFDGSEPFGFSYGTRVYWWLKVDTDGDGIIGSTETAFDYVVVVLDRPMGDTTGWMGSRGYNTDWNDGDYWAHIGYPVDTAGGQRPTFIGYQDFDDTFKESTSGRNSFGIEHQIDVWPGQSGGPYFGWWEGEPWPRVVGIQSTENWGGTGGPNTCSGGNPLSELINYARSVEP